MKKVLFLTLFFLFALVLVACGKKTFTVTFDTDGGSAVAAQVVNKGEAPKVPGTDPEKAGYVFAGWYESKTSTTKYNFTKVIEADVTVYAQWTVALAEYVVTFDVDGGTPVVQSQTVTAGGKVVEPTAPTKEDYYFAGWFVGETPYDFDAVVNANLTLKARWTQTAVVSFDTKGNGVVASQELPIGSKATLPADPTRQGFEFKGWYTSKAGYSWQNPNSYDFGTAVTSSLTLYAYYEPINSKAVTYSDGETYKASLASAISVMNPLTYSDSGQSSFIGLMTGGLYKDDVDWIKAMNEGVADYEGDFSKIISGDVNIEALDYNYSLDMAVGFPKDIDGYDYADENGQINRREAASQMSTVWTIELRTDLKFEDGTAINAHTYAYTIKQYLDPLQLNSRANLFYEAQYLPIVNAKAYLEQLSEGNDAVAWENVGVKVLTDYTLELTLSVETSQMQVITGLSGIGLVHQAKYESGFNEAKTTTNYGTVNNPFVSYGPYILKTWDAGKEYIFNKNYNYVGKGDVSYKSIRYEIIDNEDIKFATYEKGDLNVAGLTGDYVNVYAADPGLYKEPDYYQQSISFLGGSGLRSDGKETPTIVNDLNFRKAIFFGFDRESYVLAAGAPNTASLSVASKLHQVSPNDTVYYLNSNQHQQNLIDLDLSPQTLGYDPEEAVRLFNLAYDAWVAAGNSGKVVIEFLGANTPARQAIANYIKKQYEDLFGTSKIEIKLNLLEGTAYTAQQRAWNYDMILNTMGGVTQATPYYIWAVFGNLSTNFQFELGFQEEIISSVVTADLSNLRRLLETIDEEDLTTAQDALLNGYQDPEYEEDRFDGVPADGIWTGTFYELGVLYYYFLRGHADYDGKDDDLRNISGALEKVILSIHATNPIAAYANATVYQFINISWPEYHSLFGWGGQKYRFLTTDPDYVA